jgi:hypothetical protein
MPTVNPEGDVETIATRATEAVRALARMTDPAAFAALLQLSSLVGECLGESARTLAEGGSWSGVADVAGVTKQAAWSRWRT